MKRSVQCEKLPAESSFMKIIAHMNSAHTENESRYHAASSNKWTTRIKMQIGNLKDVEIVVDNDLDFVIKKGPPWN